MGFMIVRYRRSSGDYDLAGFLGRAPFGCSATLRNTRSKSGLGFSAPTSRAMSMKRFDCSGSSGFRLLELVMSRLRFATFFADPDILPPLLSLITHQPSRSRHPHSTFAAERAGIGWLLTQCVFKCCYPGSQSGEPLAKQYCASCPCGNLRADRQFGGR
jgi:hypothetical protein